MADRAQYYNDPEEALRLAMDGRQSQMWTAMPGIVTEVDLAKMTCSVQPAIQGTVTNEQGQVQAVNYPLLLDVPICFPKVAGFALTLPLAVNDEVLVVFSSRCIDAWWQSGGVQRPMEARMHDFSDGFAIPGPCSQPNVIPNISSTGAQIRNTAGTTYIEIASDGKIKMSSPEGIEVDGDLTVTGDVDITGETNVDGDIIATGEMTADGEVTAMAAATPVTLSQHVHGGVTSGGNSTTGPVG